MQLTAGTCFVGAWLLLMPASAMAQPVPALDITDLVQRADVIAIGTIWSVRGQGRASTQIHTR